MVLGADDRGRELGDPARDHRRPGTAAAEGALIDLILGDGSRPIGPEALDAAGRLVADSLICGIAGAPFARSRALRQVLRTSGGRAEAEVFGQRRRLPAASAAMANAEAINLLDADDTFLDIAHFGGLIVAVALAEAQRTGADWTTFRRAVVRGFDANARLAIATRARSGMIAPGLMMLGATVAAVGAAGGGDRAASAALSLAMRTAPTATTRAVSLAKPGTLKYAPYGALAQGAIQAARLAEAGYVSAADPVAFFAAQQVELTARRLAPAAHWWIERTALKPWPSFRLGHPVLDALGAAIGQNDILPGDIDRILLWLDPRALDLPFHDWPDPLDFDPMLLPLAAAMNLRLSAALVAAGVPPGPAWAQRRTLRRAEVRSLMRRVEIAAEPAVDAAWLEQRRDAETGSVPRGFGRAQVEAGGRQFVVAREGADGDRANWDWLRRKAVRFLGSPDIVDRLASLEANAPAPALTLQRQ